MTYRQAIQKMVEELDKIYTDAGWLRDNSNIDDQVYFNKVRNTTGHLMSELNKLDNTLTDRNANRAMFPG